MPRDATAVAQGTFHRRNALVRRHVQPRRVCLQANVRAERRPLQGRSRPSGHSPAAPRPRRSGTFCQRVFGSM
eukprot:6180639-Pleurochrysis_carterae.AAC.1